MRNEALYFMPAVAKNLALTRNGFLAAISVACGCWLLQKQTIVDAVLQ
jgi:hypothetical protein